jgi:hypothetical protein
MESWFVRAGLIGRRWEWVEASPMCFAIASKIHKRGILIKLDNEEGFYLWD